MQNNNKTRKTARKTRGNCRNQGEFHVLRGTCAKINDASTIIVKYPSGLIEKIEWEDEKHDALKSTVYLPVNMTSDTDIFSLRTLKPGESIKGQLWYKNREVDD